MTARPTDELWERMRRLEAERMRPDRPERVRPPAWRADLRQVIGVLAELLSRPGPPDGDHPVEPVLSRPGHPQDHEDLKIANEGDPR